MIKHKQTTPYGCGMYAVANALNLDSFVTEQRLEESIDGNTIYQLNRWLDTDGHNYNIECMYHTTFQNNETGHGIVLPRECEIHSDNENKTIPILLNVQKSEKAKTHLVAAWLTDKGMIVVDSVKDDIIPTHWKDINSIYEFVYGIWIFQERVPNAKGYICFENDNELKSVAPATFN